MTEMSSFHAPTGSLNPKMSTNCHSPWCSDGQLAIVRSGNLTENVKIMGNKNYPRVHITANQFDGWHVFAWDALLGREFSRGVPGSWLWGILDIRRALPSKAKHIKPYLSHWSNESFHIPSTSRLLANCSLAPRELKCYLYWVFNIESVDKFGKKLNDWIYAKYESQHFHLLSSAAA